VGERRSDIEDASEAGDREAIEMDEEDAEAFLDEALSKDEKAIEDDILNEDYDKLADDELADDELEGLE